MYNSVSNISIFIFTNFCHFDFVSAKYLYGEILFNLCNCKGLGSERGDTFVRVDTDAVYAANLT